MLKTQVHHYSTAGGVLHLLSPLSSPSCRRLLSFRADKFIGVSPLIPLRLKLRSDVEAAD